MEKSPFGKPSNQKCSRNIVRLLCNCYVNYHVYNSPSPIHILNGRKRRVSVQLLVHSQLLILYNIDGRWMKCGCGAVVESYRQREPEYRKTPVPVKLCVPQIPDGLALARIWASAFSNSPKSILFLVIAHDIKMYKIYNVLKRIFVGPCRYSCMCIVLTE